MTSIFYSDSGEGLPVVFLHGFCETSDIWSGIQSHLSKKFRIITVDLPGFGYAKTSKKERNKWGSLVSEYIKNTDQIHYAFHLVDCRYEPTELDINLNQWLHYGKIDFSVILNKADKLSQSDFVRAVKTIRNILPELDLNENLFYYSSVKGKWKKSVQKKILDLFY